jgi:hypothetical protein
MSWILSNWVERRAAREQHLRNAADVWKKAQGAVAEACDSLERHYPNVATLRRTDLKEHLLVVTITRTPSGSRKGEVARTRVVEITFEAHKPQITITEDDNKTLEFPIEADSDHAFITLQGRELLPDEFSRFALEAAFFTPLEATPAHSGRMLRILR